VGLFGYFDGFLKGTVDLELNQGFKSPKLMLCLVVIGSSSTSDGQF
jgi:hypothetical protein